MLVLFDDGSTQNQQTSVLSRVRCVR